ncbi:Uncharacterised protein [Brucella intermedia]|nr:hypothetical protein AS855_18860 [Brucella intermedia M86]SUB13688.1 Uncharacterised protein [Brucella intermedia]
MPDQKPGRLMNFAAYYANISGTSAASHYEAIIRTALSLCVLPTQNRFALLQEMLHYFWK